MASEVGLGLMARRARVVEILTVIDLCKIRATAQDHRHGQRVAGVSMMKRVLMHRAVHRGQGHRVQEHGVQDRRVDVAPGRQIPKWCSIVSTRMATISSVARNL